MIEQESLFEVEPCPLKESIASRERMDALLRGKRPNLNPDVGCYVNCIWRTESEFKLFGKVIFRVEGCQRPETKTT